jgi:signal peptidase I
MKTEERKAKKKEQAPAEGKPSAFRENFASLVATAVLALFFTTFVAQAFEIPSESMEDTLLIGDRPFVEKIAFAPRTSWLGPLLPYGEIRRGDIIVFKHPGQPDRIHMVKRVIGLPGDRLRIVRRQLIVNGRLLDEGYKIHKTASIEEYRDNFPGPPVGPVYPEWADAMPKHVKDGWLVVPPGHYFAMGDNRDNSLDSRYWGFVPRENILGKPLVLYWSLDLNRNDYQVSGLVDRVFGVVRLVIDLPRKTRWSRLFLPVRAVTP